MLPPSAPAADDLAATAAATTAAVADRELADALAIGADLLSTRLHRELSDL